MKSQNKCIVNITQAKVLSVYTNDVVVVLLPLTGVVVNVVVVVVCGHGSGKVVVVFGLRYRDLYHTH